MGVPIASSKVRYRYTHMLRMLSSNYAKLLILNSCTFF